MVHTQNRRTVLKQLGAASLLGVPLAGMGQQAQAIKIGLLTDMNGPLSQMVGPGAVVAAKMAI